MRVSSLLSLSAAVSSAWAFPTYADVQTRQAWEVKPWTAPGPSDGRWAHSIIKIEVETLRETNILIASTRTMSGPQYPCQSWIPAFERPGYLARYTGQGNAGRVQHRQK
jgi:hypothetical protein